MKTSKSNSTRLPDPEKSLQIAVRKAYAVYKKAGIDPVIWKNGRVVRLKLGKKKAA